MSSSTFPEAGTWDIVFKTADGILFYVDSARLPSGAFPSAARSISSHGITVNVAEASAVLNVILHTLYDAAFTSPSPSMDLLDTSIDRMSFHGIKPPTCIVVGCVVYRLLLTLAPDYAYRVYALAAFHKLHNLATEVSQYTLQIPIAVIPDEQVERMGAVYYKRLITLHFKRKQVLRDIVAFSPPPHPRTESCGHEQYITLTRAWTLRVAELLLSDLVLGGITIDMLRDWFMTLESDLSCDLCVETLKSRVTVSTSQWTLVKNTI